MLLAEHSIFFHIKVPNVSKFESQDESQNLHQFVLTFSYFETVNPWHIKEQQLFLNVILFGFILNLMGNCQLEFDFWYLEQLFKTSGADPGFDQGEPQFVTGLNCRWCPAASCKRSDPFSAWGSGASHRALEAPGYFITKYAFSPF